MMGSSVPGSRFHGYKNYRGLDLERAMAMVHDGAVLAHAAQVTGVPKTTIRRHTKSCRAHQGFCRDASLHRAGAQGKPGSCVEDPRRGGAKLGIAGTQGKLLSNVEDLRGGAELGIAGTQGKPLSNVEDLRGGAELGLAGTQGKPWSSTEDPQGVETLNSFVEGP